MALVLNDRVKETTTTTGTGTVNLGGAATGFETFVAGVGNSNTTYYCITAGAEFEVGIGTVTDATPDTLSRTTILSSSNSDSAVDFSAGTKDVFCTLPASKAVFEDASSNVTLPGIITAVGTSVFTNLDISGDVDVDGTLEADAMTLNSTAITTTATLDTGISNNNVPKFTSGVADDDFLRVNGTAIEGRSASEVLSDIGASAAAGSSSIVTTGALDSGSITSGFGTINNGSSTITTTGAITGGSLVADNITIDGTEIDLSSGNLTLDVAGNIKLNADGGQIAFEDGSAEIGVLENSSSNFSIEAKVQDKDLLFKGNDGGSGITALTLDMSEAGNASFNGTVTANAGVVVDNITIDGTTISQAGSSDLTIDVGGRIDLSADDNGEVRLFDGSSMYAQFKDDSDSFVIQSLISDADMHFLGNDGGSAITALTFDMSEGGSATFNKDIFLSDNSAVRLGTGQDLALFHDGADSTIRNTTGNLTLDVAGSIILDADGTGVVDFKDGGTNFGRIENSSSDFKLESRVQDKDIVFVGNDGGSGITALTLDMSEAGAATFNNNVTAFSDERLKDNIETLEDGLDKVEQLRGVTYTRDDREEIGVIAQEVEKILPEIVLTADDEMGTKSVDYSRITAVLIEAVKELSARVKELENK